MQIDSRPTQTAIQVERRADERKMRERLREVPQRFAARADLFPIQAEVIGVSEHLFKEKPRVVQALWIVPPSAGQGFHQPETANIERAFRALQPVRRFLDVIAVTHACRDEKTPDGLKGAEGTFNICSFWLVEALTRAGRHDPERLNDARLLFEQMLGYANHLGLYGEEISPRGEALGNFPQALTHLSLISAAFNLDRSLGGTGIDLHE